MGGYQPTYVKGYETGLVQSREEFILPNDAYPILENAFVWRERIKRKQGTQILGRFRRVLTAQSLGNSGASPWTFVIYSTLVPSITGEPNAEIQPGSVVITIQAGPDIVFTDQGDGTLTSPTAMNSGTINYSTGSVTLTTTAVAGTPTIISFNYYPDLPVMGLRRREKDNTTTFNTVGFDTKYAYQFVGTAWQELIPGFTWTGLDSDFFWTTNYWQSPPPPTGTNKPIFWATNNTGYKGATADSIRYTDYISGAGGTWIDFAPTINAAGDLLIQCLALIPFRGFFLAFNTWEGTAKNTMAQYPQRIRWSALGNPISDVSTIFPIGTTNPDAWRDDIRGKGGFLNLPTSQEITAIGFVRDNLVIYAEQSTWQLRYTGRTIQPFQIERVNSELGAASTFSAVQFDTSLVGIGDKGVVECDSYKSERIDIKIPDLVFQFNNENFGEIRVYGIRDFEQRLAFWTYPFRPDSGPSNTFPNRRLVYNYENDSWAIFVDSFTCFGTFQPQSARTWANTPIEWEECNFTWGNRPPLTLPIIAGNQQGFVSYIDQETTNDISLVINNITGNTTTATSIKSVNHNLENGQVISISGLLSTDPFFSINGNKFSVVIVDADNFLLYKYNASTQQFSDPQLNPTGTYLGSGKITVRDNFSITSKKFNFLDDGQNIQLGYIDVLMDTTSAGAVTLNIYLDYNDSTPVNTSTQNLDPTTGNPDPFFNSTVPTTNPGGLVTSKNWRRVFCPVRGSFVTLEWTLSNAQLVGAEQESNVQIDAQILWMRRAGRLQSGVI